MAAKDIIFDEKARARVQAGVDTLANAVKVTLGPRGRNVGDREVVGRPDGHQGRRHRRQGDRAREQVREHGRADGEGGRFQDLGQRRRRHHHRDGARAGDLSRGLQARRGRSQPDGAQARHRHRRRGAHRAAEEALDPDQGQGRHRAGRHDQRERRHRDRQHDCRGDEEGRQGRRDHGRGGQDDDQRARRRRGYAVRPRLPLAVLRDRHRAHGSRARTTATSSSHEKKISNMKELLPRSRAGREAGQAAPHHRGRRRWRGARDARRQQAPRHAADLRRQGAGLRRSPQGDAEGHRRPHRRQGGHRGPRPQAREPHARRTSASAKRITVDKDNTTIVDGAGKKADIEARVKQIRNADRGDHVRLRPREAPGAPREARRWRRRHQGRRCDRGRDEGEEGPRRGRAARDARGRRRGRRPRRRRRAAPRAERARRPQAVAKSRRSASRSCAARSRSRSARSRRTRASTARSSCQQGQGRPRLVRLQRADARVHRPRQGRRHRPDEGRPHGAAERGLGRVAPPDDRGDDRRASEEGCAAPPAAVAAAAWVAWAAWAAWTSRESDRLQLEAPRETGAFSFWQASVGRQDAQAAARDHGAVDRTRSPTARSATRARPRRPTT